MKSLTLDRFLIGKGESSMGLKTIKVDNLAQAYLELLNDRGIDQFFANAGTDFAPLIDAFAFFAKEGKRGPKPVTVAHENVAVAMAHGRYLVTGKPQVVMVHVNVGTANAINGIINASREHIPIIFTAGRTPLTEAGCLGSRNLYIHWSQETFDQASMVREYVKWDYELRNFTQLEAVVDRAIEIAMAEPRGPVYLTLPREILACPQSEFTLSSPPRRHTGDRLYPNMHSIEAAASMIASAQNPLMITANSGRNPETVRHLVNLAESFAISTVVFNPRYMCFPTNHPMHVGFSPDPFLDKSDVILVVDSDVPWYPIIKQPKEQCKVIQMGIDPFYQNYPIRSFPCDLAIQADSSVAVPLLTEALSDHIKKIQDRVTTRYQHVYALHKEQRNAWRQALEKVRHSSPLDPLWVSYCINSVKDENTIIFNEYDLAFSQVEFNKPGSFFGNPTSGGLGWGLGASLGAKLGAPSRLVIAALGDGSYMFGNPIPSHLVSRTLEIPILTVIFNNGCWNAVRQAAQGMYSSGWAARTGHFPLSDLKPSPHYEKIVLASEGYGERVEKASEVQPALERALKTVREEGRQAVLNMICKHPGE
jgi:acetolactate synthase I/II/III large subunit